MKYNVLNQMTARSLPAGKHADGRGLWLCKRNQRFGKWVQRITLHGRRREMGLGPWPDVSIAEARKLAAEARQKVRQGIDPIIERLRERQSAMPMTLAEAIEGCFLSRKAQLKNEGKAGRWLSPLTNHIIPKIGKIPVEEVSQHHLQSTLAPIWHNKASTAEKALQRTGLALTHAAALGLEVDLNATRKAQALLGAQRHSVTHIAAMPYAETPAFYRWLETKSGVAALALRFLILTAGRTSEVRLATFSEIKEGIWLLPAERTKTNQARRIPLSEEAIVVVETARNHSENDFLFPSYKGRPMSDSAMSKLMREAGYRARPHGFRSTIRTWAEETTDADYATKETLLGHNVDSGVVGAYQRSDRLEKRRSLLIKWSKFIA
ncbi:MAG: tyrosine-type recombinase/integrase [Sphingorhabdus sp.]